jgi:hypothetical protein
MFFVLPNFLTLENAPNVPPLSTREKFAANARGSFDPVQFVWYGALAGIAQAQNSDPGYGQGADGYAKRYAQRFADGTIQNFFSKAVFPSLLRQDPRYFQLGKGGFFHRLGYALSRVVVTRSDAGTYQFNFSEILGSGVAAAISNTYHPSNDRNLGNTLNVWGTQVGFDAVDYAMKEFWPDIRRKLHPPKSGSSKTNGTSKP